MRNATEIEWPAGDSGARVLGASPRKRGPFAGMLVAVLEVFYGTGVRLRNFAYNHGVLRTQRSSIPTISIGNLVAGGAGKTPFTRWLVGELTARGRRVAVVHGGYASDEPALHRLWQPDSPVYEQKDRVKAVEQAVMEGADVAVLDDAFQHRRLRRDLDIVLVPVESLSRRLLPRGPMREPEQSLERADVIVVTRKTAPIVVAREAAHRICKEYDKPCVVAAILPTRIRHMSGESGPAPLAVVIVTAIARPDLLLAHVRGQRIEVVRMLAYPDHHVYGERDIKHITDVAGELAILTTEKDAVKLSEKIELGRLWVMEQTVVIEQGKADLIAQLERVL